MTKFRTLSLALTCLLAIGLASCAPTTSPDVTPQETSVESPVPPQADLETPQPVQISIIDLLDDAPPEFLSGTLALHKLPKDAQAVTADVYPTLASSLRAYGVVPLLGEGVHAYEGGGESYLAAPQWMLHPSGAEMSLAEVRANGLVRYTGQNANGLTHTQWMVGRVPCPEGQVCVPVVSMNERDSGVVYAVAIDEATGEPVGRMRLVYDEMPSVTDYGISVGGRALTMEPIGSDWVKTVAGEQALWQMAPNVISYEHEGTVDQKVMIFQVGETVFSATEDEIFHHPVVGGYVASEDGVFVYDSQAGEWKQPEVQTQADEAEILVVNGASVVRAGNELVPVDKVESRDGASVVKTDGGKLVWQDGQWVELSLGIPTADLAGMDEATKRARAAELAVDEFSGKALSGQPEVDGNVVIWRMSENYTTLEGGTGTREVIAGAWDLESGEWIERYSYTELSVAFEEGEIELGERIFWNGEMVEYTTITETGHPLYEAQNVEIAGVGPAGQGPVEVLQNAEGEIVAVNWRYFPTAENSNWMTYSKIAGLDGQRIIVLDLVETGLLFDYTGVDKGEVDEWLKTSIKYVQTRTPMHELVEREGSTLILVNGRHSNYPENAGGYPGVSNRYPLERWSSASVPPAFKLDLRSSDEQGMVGVLTNFRPDRNISPRTHLKNSF